MGSAQQEVVITLERTPCFGTCPVYGLRIEGSGEVTFEGKAHVRTMGVARARIAEEEVRQLVSEFERANFFSLADRYAHGEPACGLYATDNPSAITSITVRGITKRVEHDYGCEDAPRRLTQLEARIDTVANSRQWTGAP